MTISFSNTGGYVIIFGFLVILLLQFLMFVRIERIIRKLPTIFKKENNLDYITLIDRVFRSKELYKPAPSSRAIEVISQYVKGLFDKTAVFIHITNEKEIADNILNEGFKYSEDFFKSTEEISSNLHDLTYKLQVYKHYGNFVVIICIPEIVFQDIKKSGSKKDIDAFAEYGISEYNTNSELSYKLSNRFVRGYIDINSRQIVENKLFKIDN